MCMSMDFELTVLVELEILVVGEDGSGMLNSTGCDFLAFAL